ncbi:MAG: amino acid transporter [SAR324 cluster bacterium]|nr:amino acid transporter [SAR324 cluster bacterium]
MLIAFAQGLTLGFSMIIAIGAQNAFVLRQGIRNENLFWVCLTCALSDIVLIITGVFLFDYLQVKSPELVFWAKAAGALYLTGYSIKIIYSVWRNPSTLTPSKNNKSGASVMMSILMSLGVTWLNPHVYLDTVVLIGSVATIFGDNKIFFGAGASLASIIFFFCLGYLAKSLRKFLATPITWKVIDITVAIIMLLIAGELVRSL